MTCFLMRRPAVPIVLAIFYSLLVCRYATAQVVIDNFDKNQAVLSQTTVGNTPSTVTGSMLAGERDEKVTVTSAGTITAEVKNGTYIFTQAAGAAGNAEIVWDGTDGTGAAINTTGLGAVNLTSGSQNAFLLGVLSANQSVSATLTIYSSGGTTKTLTFTIPAGTTPNYMSLAHSTFTGTGNFTAVGAIQLVINSTPGATLVLDFLRTTSTTSTPLVDATLTDVVLVDNDGNGKASPGDTLRYIVRIKNNDSVAKTGVTFDAPTPANTTLGTVSAAPLTHADGPSGSTSAPGETYHGSFNTTLNVAAPGLLSNDFLGSPSATITSFGVTSYATTTLNEAVTVHSAGTAASFGGNTLTVNANGSVTLVPSSTFSGVVVFQYRLANASGTSDGTATLAIGFRPSATPDSYTATGNIQMSQAAGNGVIQKATADTGSALAVTTFGPNLAGVGNHNAGVAGLTLNNGNLTLNADGSFTYNPPVGFTGSDSFVYKVDNGFSQPSTATVTITVSGMVWFINNAVGAGDGRLTSPFNSLAAFVVVNDGGASHPKTGDNIFLYTGSGNYSGTTAPGLSLLNNQKLIGQGANAADLAAATGITFAPGSATLPSLNGTDPAIVNSTAGGHGITLASGNTIRGLTVGNTPNGFGFSGGAVGTLTLSDTSKTGTGGTISITSSGAFGSTVTFDLLESTSSTGANLNLVSVTGTLAANSWGAGFSGSAASSAAINISGGSVSFTDPANVTKSTTGALLSVASGHNGTLTFQTGTLSATTGTGLQFDNADGTYNFNGTTTLNGGDAGVDILNDSAGTFTFGTGTAITSPTGIAFNVDGQLTTSTATVTYSGNITQANSAAMVTIKNHNTGTITFQTGTLNASNGTGLQFDNADSTTTTGYSFNGTVTLNGGDAGIDIINGSSGNFSFANAPITNPSGTGFNMLNSDGSVSHAGAISKNSAGRAISIDNHDGNNNVTFSGSISSTASSGGILVQNCGNGAVTFSNGTKTLSTGASTAVTLANNTGATINFTGGGLAITTTSGTGFNATGGGTVTVQGAGNTINASSGIGLNIANTTIGSVGVSPETGLRFQLISSGGAANVGISLDTTGTSGGLTVTGTGTAASGGTIANKTGADGSTTAGIGIYLNNTRNISLSRMQLNDFQNFAIRGITVTGFSLSNSTINGANGTSTGADEGCVIFDSLLGTSTISSVSISGSIEDNLRIRNSSGTADDIIITGCTFVNAPNDNLIIEPSGTAVVTAHVTNNTFSGAGGDHFQTATSGSATLNVVFTGNFYSMGSFVGSLLGGITISGGNAGSTEHVNFNISNNGSAGNPLVGCVQGGAININEGNGGGTWQGQVSTNFIGNGSVALSGAAQSSGIRVENHSPSGTLTAILNSNNIKQWGSGPAINSQAGDAGVPSLNGRINLTLKNNLASNPGPSTQHGFVANIGAAGVGTGDSSIAAIDIQNNSLDGNAANGGSSIRLRQRENSTIILPGYGGTKYDTTAVGTYIVGRNPGQTTANATSSAGPGYINGTVPTPTVPN